MEGDDTRNASTWWLTLARHSGPRKKQLALFYGCNLANRLSMLSASMHETDPVGAPRAGLSGARAWKGWQSTAHQTSAPLSDFRRR